MSRRSMALAVLGALAAAFLAGRMTAPERVIVKEKAAKFERREAEVKEILTAATSTVTLNGAVITRWRQCPVCPGAPEPVTIVERIEHRTEDRREATTAQQAQSRSAESALQVREVVTQPALHRFVLGLRGALDAKLRTEAEAYGGVRLFDNVEAGLSYDVVTRRPAVWARYERRF